MTLELADRIEALDGPDREIALEIVHLVYGDDKDMKRCVERGTFDPTASVDAALTLVPDGWVAQITQLRNGLWRTALEKVDGSDVVHAFAETEPLSRSAAALRACHSNTHEGTD